MPLPLVSVICRALGGTCLERAVGSVQNQDYPNIQLVIVPMAGTRINHPAAIKVRRPLNRGEAAHLGLKRAKGDFINFLDEEDELLPHHVSTCLSALLKQQEQRYKEDWRLVFSQTERMNDRNIPSGIFPGVERDPGCLVPVFSPHSCLFNYSLLDKAKHDPFFKNAYADFDFWVQCYKQTNFLFLNQITSRSYPYQGPQWSLKESVKSEERIKDKWPFIFTTC